jgi:nucleoside-diphosphate-sugar epimerase
VKRVLLTGASGFIGRSCTEPLRRAGFDVHAVSRGTRRLSPGVTAWAADLMDPAQVRRVLDAVRPTHLLHAAWDVTPPTFWTSPDNLRWLAAGVALLDAFRTLGGERAVGVGTCAEYAWTVRRYHETDGPSAAATPYGRCKRALGDAFAAAGGLGLSTAWARIFFPYGPGDAPQRLVPTLMANLSAGRRFATTSGIQLRDFIYIDDIGAVLAALLAAPTSGAINIANGEAVPLRHVIETVSCLMGRPDLLDIGALAIRPGDPPELVADLTRLTDEIGFLPRIGLNEGLARTVAAFLGQESPSP